MKGCLSWFHSKARDGFLQNINLSIIYKQQGQEEVEYSMNPFPKNMHVTINH